MQDQLSALLAKAAAELPAVATRPEFEAAKARYVGPHGELTGLMKQMGAVPKEQRPAVGKLINEAMSLPEIGVGWLRERLYAATVRESHGRSRREAAPTSLTKALPIPGWISVFDRSPCKRQRSPLPSGSN